MKEKGIMQTEFAIVPRGTMLTRVREEMNFFITREILVKINIGFITIRTKAVI